MKNFFYSKQQKGIPYILLLVICSFLFTTCANEITEEMDIIEEYAGFSIDNDETTLQGARSWRDKICSNSSCPNFDRTCECLAKTNSYCECNLWYGDGSSCNPTWKNDISAQPSYDSNNNEENNDNIYFGHELCYSRNALTHTFQYILRTRYGRNDITIPQLKGTFHIYALPAYGESENIRTSYVSGGVIKYSMEDLLSYFFEWKRPDDWNDLSVELNEDDSKTGVCTVWGYSHWVCINSSTNQNGFPQYAFYDYRNGEEYNGWQREFFFMNNPYIITGVKDFILASGSSYE